jgi:predicted Zn-dependent peptidase
MRIHKKKLSNGLTMIVIPMKDSPTVTVLTMVGTGSEYEKEKESGISHFLEHMCFKGTAKRPRSIDMSLELDNMGAQNNAFTSFEYTGYYAKAHPKHTAKLIDIISDLYLNPTFPETELEKEKGVIIEEMNMYADLPQRKVHEVFGELLYGNTPAGRSILGSKEVIKGATQKDFINYRAQHYVSKATTVIVAGNVTEANVFGLITKAFKDIKNTPKRKKEKVKAPTEGPRMALQHKATDQTHMVIGFPTFKVTDKRNTTLSVLNTLLGEGMSSRLFQKLREDMGVCYYTRSGSSDFTDHGEFTISAGVDPDRVPEVITAILEECTKLKTIPVSPEELTKAKEYYAGNMAMALESSDAVAHFVGDQALNHKEIQTPQEIEKKLRAVTAKQIQTLAKQIFTPEKLYLAIVGNIKDEKGIKKALFSRF